MAEQQTPEMTKEAEATARHRAFEVGIAHLCKEAGFSYADFAKAAGETPETLSQWALDQIQQAIAAQK